ncbi:gamma protein [Porcine ephemerovirus 1]|uniref:Gamma protein n=1 Tax=Porcine ephemerovirus 1 TaxID=2928256 RepID=A0AAX3A8Q6_9RHAB|nr:gamma protein [Porcine ephemerovirus 1]UNP42115.1 gamma protein [Porcine ephemerovirus 1]
MLLRLEGQVKVGPEKTNLYEISAMLSDYIERKVSYIMGGKVSIELSPDDLIGYYKNDHRKSLSSVWIDKVFIRPNHGFNPEVKSADLFCVFPIKWTQISNLDGEIRVKILI